MADWKDNKGKANLVSFDGGKFRGYVSYAYTGGHLQIKPYIEITDGFSHSNRVQYRVLIRGRVESVIEDRIEQIDADDYETLDVNELNADSYTSTQKWTTWAYAKTKNKDGKKENLYIKSKTDGTPLRYNNSALHSYDMTVSLEVRVHRNAYTKTKTVTKNKKKVKVKEKVKAKNSSVSSCSLDLTELPLTPQISHYYKNADNDIHAEASFPATIERPILKIHFERISSSKQDSWNAVRDPITIGTNDGVSSNGTRWHVDDTTVATSGKYKYRFYGSNAKGAGGTAETDWLFTTPPPVSEFTAEQVKNSNKILLTMTRESAKCTERIIRGYRIEYNDDPDDLGTGVNWKTLVEVTDDNTSGATSRTYTIADAFKNNVESITGGAATTIPWTSPTVETISFYHKNAAADKGLRYRVRTINFLHELRDNKHTTVPQLSQTLYPSVSGTSLVYTTPNPPSSVEAMFTEDNVVVLSIKKQGGKTTADSMNIQRKTSDDSDWVDLETGVSLSESYTDSAVPLGVTVRYRVSFQNSSAFSNPSLNNGLSDYTESNEAILLRKPNPPTLVNPINNSKWMIETDSFRLVWIHNPRDMQDQTAFGLQFRFKNGTDISDWVDYTDTQADQTNYAASITREQLISLASKANSQYKPNTIVQWRARTKASEKMGFSDWSTESTFKILSPPEVSITSPTNATSIGTLPVKLGWTYTDLSGSIYEINIEIIYKGDVVHTIKLPRYMQNTYDIRDFLFDNYEDYSIRMTFVSTSTLSSTAEVNIHVRYVPVEMVNGVDISSVFYVNAGYSMVTLSMGSEDIGEEGEPTEPVETITPDDVNQDDDQPQVITDDDYDEPDPIVIDSPVSKVYVYRNYDGERTFIKEVDASEIMAGDSGQFSFIDLYCPINREFEYELLQLAESGELGYSVIGEEYGSIDNPILWWYALWESDGEINTAKAMWNPTNSVAMGRPEKQQIRYSGRKYPVTYDSDARSETASFTTELFRDPRVPDDGWETITNYRKLMRDGGHGIWKSFEGDVYAADFDFSYNSNYSDPYKKWSATLNVTRVEREEED